MDTISLYYFSESAKDLNFTKTAKRLFTSQQNLSNHIARLEEYYEVKLFERKPRLALTYSGEILLSYAQSFHMDEMNLKNALDDIKKKEKGKLHIGGSPTRTSIVMPQLAECFAKKYPNVELHFYHHHSSVLSEMMLSGDLDFSIGIGKAEHPNLISTKLFDDTIYLVVSDKLLREHQPNQADKIIERSKAGADIRDFAALPFINIRSTQIILDCFHAAGCEPNFIVTSNYPQFFLPNYYENMAASIITRTVYCHIREVVSDGIHLFPVKTNKNFNLHPISFIRHKHKYLSQYGQYFFDMTIEYFNQLDNALNDETSSDI